MLISFSSLLDCPKQLESAEGYWAGQAYCSARVLILLLPEHEDLKEKIMK